ncbi:lipoyl synthase [Candidatus Synchoanobacter obligatus]|uniref:Lipoyl synthase n=1 Tax=Candidatus Synchoanobacter obligatus TaxID=2919597 RepID=A0ABT1L504_9GAMM|nr:lipoyl synthase [Candidatus Synchoanobacter obligatus]MCP8351948.1 lipoyl synthase [Candidatus Synchoanobacter obligatus]
MNDTTKQRGYQKLQHITIESTTPIPRHNKPKIRPSAKQIQEVSQLKKLFSQQNLVTVCEEANCPNLIECYSHKIATFMIMGDKCTRRCAFCDVAHGKPNPLDPEEPRKLAETIKNMGLKYIVITSVDRDDLRDGGANHFVQCIQAIRQTIPKIKIEVLVPDFKKRHQLALSILKQSPPDVFNHNIETIPRLYKTARVGSDYQHSLTLLKEFHDQHPSIPTKSGIMVGLGETDEELIEVFQDLRDHHVSMITIGQYLAPSPHHMPVSRYLSEEGFLELGSMAHEMGFSSVASGPLVRSSYHADKQAETLNDTI